jgi:hypothetical protein
MNKPISYLLASCTLSTIGLGIIPTLGNMGNDHSLALAFNGSHASKPIANAGAVKVASSSVCFFSLDTVYSSRLVDTNNKIFEYGTITNLEQANARLQGNEGFVYKYSLNGFGIKIFIPDRSDLKPLVLLSDREWITVVKSDEIEEDIAYLTTSYTLAKNSFGIETVYFSEKIEKRRHCT